MDETIAYLPGLSPVENKELCARGRMENMIKEHVPRQHL